MKAKKILKAAGLAVGTTAGVGLGQFYRYCFCRDPGPLAKVLDSKGHEEDYYHHRDTTAAQLAQLDCQRFTRTNSRGIRLEGYYYQSGSQPSGKIAFIIHGYRSEHLETAGMYYEYYFSRGIDVFCCDHGAAGESGGSVIGYDVFESRDCLDWLEFLYEQFGREIQVLLHGFSMGGATVLSMSDRVGDQVKCIVSDSGYTSAAEILSGRVGALATVMSGINRVVAGYTLADTDVREHVKHSRVPILFVHGRQDKTVPFSMGEELYALCPGEKDCLWIDNARHVECMHCAKEAYEGKLDHLLRTCFKLK